MRTAEPAARSCVALLTTTLAMALALPARAADAEPRAVAEALFIAGRALLDADRVDLACADLAESTRLEPSVGALGLLAACHERQGLLIASLREYVEAATRAAARGDPREAFAWDRAADVQLKLPRLRVELADPGYVVELRRGPTRIPPRTIGDDFVVDPGRVEIVVRAPGKVESRSVVELAEGTRVLVSVPPLAPAPPPAVGAPPKAPRRSTAQRASR